ncbi:hypothetical protein ACJMK2_027625 [Sinanodonta woodiana]|uniref:PAS domain-containing protein n=1 Tax=Sinanodonta woodiana TaxID=1069815 RepID=A0ABD3X847_SINWO
MMFGYSDRDLLVKSGYDLVHPDDLNYFSLGHQELIKTGSSGLIAYRWLTKDFQWIWLQSSCKVIYKNSKPDFVICTHRQLTDDEGQDLFHKRGSEFKLPYPLLDLDICSGFDFPADESSTKLKGTRGKKQKNQMKDFSTKRKKSGCREPINGLNGYGPYQALNGYENGELKPEFLYHYPSQNFGIEPDLLYNRSHGYTSFPGSMYPTPESYRLDMEKHGYSNGYYIDPHRQYQHPVPYPSNSYADLVTPGTKFPYDVAKYGFDTYSLDLAKKVHYSEELSRYENDYRKYGYEYGADRLAPRINGTLEPVDLRSTSMYNGATIANGMESGIPPPPCVPPSPSILRSDLCHGQNFHSRESKVIRSPTNGMQNDGMNSISIPSNSVIKNTTTPRSVHANNRSTSAESLNSPNTNTYQNQMRGNVIQNSSTLWAQCAKSRQAMNNPSPISTPHSDHSGSSPKHKRSVPTVDLTSDQMNGRVGMVSDKPDSNGQINSPVSGVTATSVIHTPISEKHLHNRTCEKQPVVGGIPVPVVKSPWIQQFPTSQYGEYKDWSMSTNDMYAYHQRQPRGIITDSLSQAHKVSIP